MTIHVPLAVYPESSTSFTLESEGRKLVRFEDKGKLARLVDGDGNRFARHDLLRWAAPFALAPQGLVCLHASAVHKEGTTIGFLGIGGAGKSTLAHEFQRQGWDAVADDLMVCDSEGRVNALAERTLRQWCEVEAARGLPTAPWIDYRDLARKLTDPSNQHWLPISGLYFLNESRGENLVIRSLSSGDAFGRFVRFGFGGLPAAEAWAHQFRVYATLASRVPAAILQPPDGLEPLRSALPHLENSLFQWLTDRTPIPV